MKIKYLLFEKFVSLLNQVGAFPTYITDKQSILTLLRSLHPKLTNKELIRLGSNGDGGYLLPNDLDNIQACFSPGINDNSDFELDCAKLGIKVFLADKSVDGPAIENKSFIFLKKYIGAISNDSFITINNWVKMSGIDSNSDLILQMDIEGFEYETILSMDDELIKRFRIMIIEFHNLKQMWNKPYFNLINSVFKKILQTHTCVHLHPNNITPVLKHKGIKIPGVMEFTFLRNDRISDQSFATVFPNSLDKKNDNKNSDIVLPEDWYYNK